MISIIYIILSFCFAGTEKAPKVEAAKPEHMSMIMDVEEKYQKAQGISMEVEKMDKLEALDQTRKFSGNMKIKKGKFRIELQSLDASKDTSLIIADGKTLWFVTPPPKEFKEAKTQVMSASMSDKRAKSQGLLQMLTEGGILKYFKVTGVVDSQESTNFFLQPSSVSNEFRRAQIVTNKKDHTITTLQYWDAMNNETVYSFSKIDFKKSIEDSLFSYTPPKDADVMKY